MGSGMLHGMGMLMQPPRASIRSEINTTIRLIENLSLRGALNMRLLQKPIRAARKATVILRRAARPDEES